MKGERLAENGSGLKNPVHKTGRSLNMQERPFLKKTGVIKSAINLAGKY
ncbi:hypothetical protein [Niastella vici]|nr:hypothetical protein [Niastella vici]